MRRPPPSSMKLVAYQVLVSLVLSGACKRYEPQLDGGPNLSPPPTAGAFPAAGAGCPSAINCREPCTVNAHCNTALGRACVPVMPNGVRALDAPSMTTLRSLGEDAGAESALDSDAGLVPAPASGYCSNVCISTACAPGMVCSSSGVCADGCDRLRPENCAPSDFCNFEQSRCFPRDGRCESELDCPWFGHALEARGARSCIAGHCRFEPAFGMTAAIKLAAPTPEDGLPQIVVQQPSPGLRIIDIDAFTFQFSVPADVMVASILLRNDLKNLTDASAAALWIAYLNQSQANLGVKLSDGGLVLNGEWQPASPQIPRDQPLYFLVLGYDKGQLVARSELIPFMVGAPLPQSGDSCSRATGEFCAVSGALVCVDGTCRTPCLSDNDCEVPLKCLPPNVLGVAFRVCG